MKEILSYLGKEAEEVLSVTIKHISQLHAQVSAIDAGNR
jgi:hypothetical protein